MARRGCREMMREELIAKFISYSERIKRALISKNYVAIRDLDLARREILEKLCGLAMEEESQEIFSLVERTIEETTSQISSITNDIKSLDMLTAKKSKMLQGYQAMN